MSRDPVQTMHRAASVIMASTGEPSIEKATERLRALRVQVILGPTAISSAALQAAALTIVNAGKRTFAGGVYVSGMSTGATRTRLSTLPEFADAIRAAGGDIVHEAVADVPAIVLGVPAVPPRGLPLVLRMEVEGWKAVVSPFDEAPMLGGGFALALAGVFGGALALSEVFAFVLHLHDDAGRRQTGLSLWELDPTADLRHSPSGPDIEYWPSNLWLIGLGHLGQAFLWSLASLEYPEAADVEIMLQDWDAVGEENHSTGLLIETASIGQQKTRVADQWLAARGFRTRLVERWFVSGGAIQPTDPSVLLVGVDSGAVRAEIARATAKALSGLTHIDVGLGSTASDFDDIVLHAAPFRTLVTEGWDTAAARMAAKTAAAVENDAIRAIGDANGLDACGMVRFAQISTGVPYVGTAAGAVAVAEILRRLSGAPPLSTVSARLRDLARGLAPRIAITATAPIEFTPRVY
jgi:hypothetical protein